MKIILFNHAMFNKLNLKPPISHWNPACTKYVSYATGLTRLNQPLPA